MQMPVGCSNFGDVRTSNLKFVDKTLFIKEIFDNDGIAVTLITRPRCFGRTFNLSTLHHFLASEVCRLKTAGLFDGLKISTVDNGHYMQYQGKYPVISINFQNIKEDSFDKAYSKLYNLIIGTFDSHNYLKQSNKLSEHNKNLFEIILGRKADRAQIENSLKTLTACLFEHHGVRPWILIDEYDTPIQSGHINNYYNEITDLMSAMLGAALNGNPYLDRSIMTDRLQVPRKIVSSGLNNIVMYSILSSKYSQHFGFTESEVHDLLQEAGLQDKEAEVKSWYNGYIFGGTTVYNPWSIVNYIHYQGVRKLYWLDPRSNRLIRSLLSDSDDTAGIRKTLNALLKGEDVIQEIDENLVFEDLKTNSLAPLSLLLMAGYLKVVSFVLNEDGEKICNCAIPNKEVQILYRDMIESWLSGDDGNRSWYRRFLRDLLSGKIDYFEDDFGQVLSQIVSVHDTTRNSENFYHGFMLGLTASLEPQEYEVKSNKESGFGRYDLVIFPKDITKYAIIFEFKSIVLNKAKASNLDSAESIESRLEREAQNALAQINDKQYIVEAEYRGFKNIIKIGIAFNSRSFSLASEGGIKTRYYD